jgi:hypothetical protein
MDQLVTSDLNRLLRQQVAAYAGEAISESGRFNLYFVEDNQSQVYCIVGPYDPAYRRADLALMARIVNDQIIIDVDKMGDPLYEALREQGIPDEQIVLAWKV